MTAVCEVNTCTKPAVTGYPGFMCAEHRQVWLDYRERELDG